ncbi:MAG: cell division protein Fic [Nitrosospira sp.]
MSNRYSIRGSEGEFEPHSRGRVLRNLLGIRSVREMAQLESEALYKATERAIDETQLNQHFDADDIRHIHRLWLGDIYSWAGEYRQVNISKDGFMFAAAHLVPGLMDEFGHDALRHYTPCRYEAVEEQAHALAVVHAELILIHPFREGNGRCARLLAVLMGLQAGLPVLDFGGIRGEEKLRYIGAIHAALESNYAPMTAIFEGIITRTLRSQAKLTRA